MRELLFKDPRDYLYFEYELRKARRPAYSMRAFSRDLGYSPSGLNDFLKARVGMSLARAEKVAACLNWSELRREHFLDLILSKYDKDTGVRQSALMRVRNRIKDSSHGVSVDAFKAISDWYHSVILEFCDIKPQYNIEQISRELSLSPVLVTKAIRRLLKLGLLTNDENGYRPTSKTRHFGDETPSEAIVAFHSQILEMAQKALIEKKMHERESHSLIYTVNQDDVKKMNSEIRKAVLNIINKFAQNPNPNCIQALSLQVFPIWQGASK